MSKRHCFKSITLSNKIAIEFVFFILIIALFSGCASKKGGKNDPFFDEWKTKAEQSKGFSPSARKRVVDLPEKAMEEKAKQEGEVPESQKSLPSNKISNLKMSNIELPVLLRSLAKLVNQNIIINDKVTGKLSINIEDAPWDQVFEGILNSHGLAYAWEGDMIRILTVEEGIALETQKREMERVEPLLTKVVQISFADSEDLKKNLETFLTGKIDGKPHGSVMVDKHTNALILHATRNDIERILPLIEELDRPTRQILIEANIVETNKDTARALGIQWGGVYAEVMGGDKTEWVTAGSTTPDPTSGLAVNFPASGTSITGTAMTLGYVIENLGKHVLAVQLSALETEGKLNILSSPSITTLDNQEAFIESGREITFINSGDTTVLGGQVALPEPIKAVLSLTVTPHVIDDKTIKIAIETTKDELDSASSTIYKQVIIKKTATTTVVLFDGQTTVIGGLSKETTGESESGVPWLRKIPLLGYLFKGEYKSREMEEILIFITPHILKEKVMDESQE
ncbi:MAG: type IV pilus secretin PilQ [Proteobacteria bacterium]|nr:type IV pilus secretin PilQ [Pseudomonadota bacterium]MBU4069057.1 type IV pilus secretin PilQ [Pseudomonadota bacterium]MBU4127629.1 type IV pilus secretin PilQ [Pseudomonadota bacterium]